MIPLSSTGWRRRALATIVAVTVMASLVAVGVPAGAAGTFNDDDGNPHEAAIEEIAALGITRGCNPPTNDRYCPDRTVTRAEMATFLYRLLDPRDTSRDLFVDDDDSVFEDAINAVARAGIVRGCNPPTNDRFCPDRAVTRAETAALIVRALGLDGSGKSDYFSDDNGSIFESDINAFARVAITRGCNPPANTKFCPNDPIRRDEMASFLTRVRAIDNTGTTVTTKPVPTTSSSTTSTTTGSSTTTSIPAASGDFLEEDGVVVMEVESLPLAGDWKKETKHGGYAGSGYYIWRGENTLKSPGSGTITYSFVISDPGTYSIALRSLREWNSGSEPQPENDKRNDLWISVDGGTWWKSSMHTAWNTWGWNTRRSLGDGKFADLKVSLDVGTHTIRISGRSSFFAVDRIHVFKGSNPGVGTPESDRLP